MVSPGREPWVRGNGKDKEPRRGDRFPLRREPRPLIQFAGSPSRLPRYSGLMPDLSPQTIDRLVEAAAEVRGRAHAPYSSFKVGAAVIDEEGRVYVGCNVENASYGLSVCAERNAVAAAVAAGSLGIEGIAVVTDTSPPTSPCGACRQVLVEFGDFPVILANPAGDRIVTSVNRLLPDAFTPESLVKNHD
jgi:cytidine deaminase